MLGRITASFAVGAAVASLILLMQPGVRTPFTDVRSLPQMHASPTPPALPRDETADDASTLPDLPAPPVLSILVYDSRQPGWQDKISQFREYADEKDDALGDMVSWEFLAVDVAKDPEIAKTFADSHALGISAARLSALQAPYVLVLEGDNAHPDGDAIGWAAFPFQDGKLDDSGLDEFFLALLNLREA